jgi:hypothetical protein
VIPRRALRDDVLGCYALFGEDGRRVDTTYYNASPVVALDSMPWRMSDSVRMDDSLRGMWRRLFAFDTLGDVSRTTRGMNPPDWSADSLSDTIRVSFVNGFSGAVFVLAAPPGHVDTLRGRALEFWDYGPSETRRGSAYAIRVRCPSTPPPPDDRVR